MLVSNKLIFIAVLILILFFTVIGVLEKPKINIVVETQSAITLQMITIKDYFFTKTLKTA